jgi:hypothetical protein
METARHPDPTVDGKLESVAMSTDHCAEEKMMLLTNLILQEFGNPLIYDQYCYRMMTFTPYIKTSKFSQKLEIDCPGVMDLLIESMIEAGYKPYFQIYPGVEAGHAQLLTSIHQDGGNSHGRILRILIRLGGQTTFYKTGSQDSAFYNAGADDQIRATVATRSAFTGISGDGQSNSSVHHAGVSGHHGTATIVIMADRYSKAESGLSVNEAATIDDAALCLQVYLTTNFLSFSLPKYL